MIEVSKLSEADRGRRVIQQVTPHVTYVGELLAWTPNILLIQFPKGARHGTIKASKIIEAVKPAEARFADAVEVA